MSARAAAPETADRKRVLLVNHTGTFGGAERSLLGLATANVADDDVEYVVATPDGRLADELRAVGASVALLPELRLSFSPRPMAVAVGLRSLGRSARAFRRLARRDSVDVIHANSLRAALLVTAALPFRRPPLVLHARDEVPGNLAGRVLTAVLRRSCSGVIAISRWIGDSYASFDRVTVIDNPVDLERFDLTGQRPSEAAGDDGVPATFLLVAQISPWKRQLDAISATVALHDEGLPVRLQLVGSVKFADSTTRLDNRAYYEQLRAEVAARDATNVVEFLGEREDVAELMRSATALLSTSEREPFGRTVAEALASGLPVVASDDGGPAELVEPGITGWVYRAGSLHSLQEAMREALAPVEDRDGSRRAAFARTRGRFDPRAHASAVRSFYAEVCR